MNKAARERTMHAKINQEIKAKWVAALRSGEYKQGIGRLKKVDQQGVEHFCCLGVLCDLYVREHNTRAAWILIEEAGGLTGMMDISGDVELLRLPIDVRHWAGIDASLGTSMVIYRDEPETLANLNDDRHLSFNEIADLIEEQL